MSYILDALRRADAERQRGAVPGLHDQPTTTALSGVAPDRGGLPRGAAWLALAVLALAGVLAAWLWSARQAPAGPAAPVPPAVAVVPAVALPAPVSATVPATVATPPPQPAPLPGAGPATPAPLAPPQAALPAMAPVPAMPAATHPVARVPGQAREPLLPAPQRRDGAAPVDGAAPPPSPPPPPARLPTLAELPESLRRDLPTLAAGGAMYADQPALRMVILNGQVFHEGDRPAAELLVQQIRPKSVVLQFRGQRFELPL